MAKKLTSIFCSVELEASIRRNILKLIEERSAMVKLKKFTYFVFCRLKWADSS